MRITLLWSVAFYITSFGCKAQTLVPQIEIIPPTIQQEATSIWRTINDITFLEKQGYDIHFPKDALIDSLIMKSKKGTFGNEDFPLIYALLENKIFDPKHYEKARRSVEHQAAFINELISQIARESSRWDWKFKFFDKYQVVFTLYGTGGSYDPEEGIITLYTNEEGGFMKYKNPAYTIIHEITHMGMEDSIVRKYQLSHGLKERVVDTFVYLMFREKLPAYDIQNIGDKKLDRYFNEKKDIEKLNAILSTFMDHHNR